MAWVSIWDTVDGPKLRKFYKILKCSKFEALGIVTFAWQWGMNNADKNGRFINADEEDLERHLYGVGSGCNLDFKKIIQAMFEVRWLEKDGDVIYFHDWDEWQKNWYAYDERRKKDKNRKRDSRNKEKTANESKKQDDNIEVDTVSPADTTTSVSEDSHNENLVESPQDSLADDPQDCPKSILEKDNYSEEFEAFWSIYPRKIEKKTAFKAYNARLKEKWKSEDINKAASNYAEECRKNKIESKYIKHASTFLSNNCPFADYIKCNRDTNEGTLETENKEPDMNNPFTDD